MDEVEALFRRAAAAQRQARFAEAVRLYRDLLDRAPSLAIAKENLCLALLGAGDYGEGFRRYDVRFTRIVGRVPRPSLSFPEWRGEALRGRSILVWMEQGLGDQIMFARFVPVLAGLGATVSILAPSPLVRLFSHLPARVIEAAGQVNVPPHDFWVMPGSIPGRLGTTPDTLPCAPYLPGAPAGVGLGVVTTCDPRHPTFRDRSLDPAAREALLRLPGAVSLAPGDTGAADFEDTASRVSGLARVITVDTSAAHLAGAMGKPVWVLLPAENCDWRWQGDRGDSPWYPTARLFRQPAPGDWTSVVAAVQAALADEPA